MMRLEIQGKVQQDAEPTNFGKLQRYLQVDSW